MINRFDVGFHFHVIHSSSYVNSAINFRVKTIGLAALKLGQRLQLLIVKIKSTKFQKIPYLLTNILEMVVCGCLYIFPCKFILLNTLKVNIINTNIAIHRARSFYKCDLCIVQ